MKLTARFLTQCFFLLANTNLSQTVYSQSLDEIQESRQEAYEANETVEIDLATFEVGPTLKPGRYEITGEELLQNVTIFNKDGGFHDRVISGHISNHNHPKFSESWESTPESYIVTVEIGHVFYNQGSEKMTFTPVTTQPFEDQLTPGMWVVGLDIPAGSYQMTADDDALGDLYIYEDDRQIKYREIKPGDNVVFKLNERIELEEGQVIRLEGFTIYFEALE